MKNITFICFLGLLIIAFNSNAIALYSSDYHCITSEINSKIKKYFNEKLLNDEIRPNLQTSVISNNNLFRIHFDTTGANAVEIEDTNHNSIPDYIDSCIFYFEYAYQTEVVNSGFRKPISDSGRGGDNLYDVYILNLVDGDYATYGYTTAEDLIENGNGVFISNSHIIIDNNYSPHDSIIVGNNKQAAFKTTGINGLRITSAHEYNHAIQYSYGIPDQYGSLLMEMTSTWMEYYVHSDIQDFVQYLTELFNSISEFPLTINTPQNGYRWSVYFQYLQKIYGINFIEKIWEGISQGKLFFNVLDTLLQQNNSNIKDNWKEFVPWLYFTSNRSLDSTYFNSANKLPKIKYKFIENLTTNLNLAGSISPFQIIAYRIFNNSSNDKNIESFDIISSFSVVNYDDIKTENFNYSINLSSDKVYSTKINYCNDLSYEDNFIENNLSKPIIYIFVNDGITYSDGSYVMPNPCIPDNDNLFISLSLDQNQADYKVIIYDTQMNTIYNKRKESIRFKGKFGVEISEKTDFNSGVYFYYVFNDENNYFGKFSILRK